MKVPLKAAVVGLLLGIILTMVLEVGTPEGTALLIVICTLVSAILGWVADAMFRRIKRT